jgi:hypothetical protein
LKLQPRAEHLLEAIVRKRLCDLPARGHTLVQMLHALVMKTAGSGGHAKRKRARSADQAA